VADKGKKGYRRDGRGANGDKDKHKGLKMPGAVNISQALASLLALVDARTTSAAQLFLGTLPILCVYPFLQKYFASGLVMGSVKG
jgi:ABC-type maltose transport system permease subunit